QAGPLKKVTIARDKEGRQRSYGFVCYKHREAVPYAIALLDGIWLYGRPIRLKYRCGGHEAGPDHSDPWCEDQSALASFPEPSVFHFTGLPDCSPLQDLLFWNMVCGRSSKQPPPGIPPPQYGAAPPGFGPPLLHWPGVECPRWALNPPSQNPPPLMSIVTPEPVGGQSETAKAEHRKRHRHNKKVHERRCKRQK
ncbi:splicing regulator RBM11, partial [Arapaima gigas]